MAYLVHPDSVPNYRLLVAHRTGAGKTLSMIRCLSNFYSDPRPKVAVFPLTIRLPTLSINYALDNPYRTYVLDKLPDLHEVTHLTDSDLDDIVKVLALHGHPGSAGKPGYLAAPLRAFSYRQIGGAALNAMSWFKPKSGCPPTDRGVNLWCDKIVVMDEAHNLIKPSVDLKNPISVANLEHARDALYRAQRTVMVLFTATPMVDDVTDIDALLTIVKGRGNEHLNDEGFVSAFYGAPRSSYPIVDPDERDVPRIEQVELSGDPDDPTTALGNYLSKIVNRDGTINKAFSSMDKRNLYEYAARHPDHQTRGEFARLLKTPQAKHLVPKLWRAAEYMEAPEFEGKMIFLTSKNHGFFALDTLIRTNPRFKHLRVYSLLGKGIKSERADWNESLKARNYATDAEIKAQFDSAANMDGSRIKALVLNADKYSEGIDFKDVRHVVLVDCTPNWATLLQRVGRAVRHCSHARLPKDKRDVSTVLLVATLPAYVRYKLKAFDLRSVLTVDEHLVLRVINDRAEIEAKMCDLMRSAVDGSILPGAGAATCGSMAYPKIVNGIRLTKEEKAKLKNCATKQHKCVSKAQHEFARHGFEDQEHFHEAIKMCQESRDDCVEDIVGPPDQDYGLNCPPIMSNEECVYHCRHELNLKGKDMGRCMARMHNGILEQATDLTPTVTEAGCPLCPDDLSQIECARFCGAMGLQEGDYYRCVTRTPATQCDYEYGVGPQYLRHPKPPTEHGI